MAQAILGDGVRVIGASFSGDTGASGLGSDGSAVLSTGSGGVGNSAHIDIDFIPETDHLALGIALVADDVPLTGQDRLLSDGLTIWINGQKQGMSAPPTRKGLPGGGPLRLSPPRLRAGCALA